MEISNSQLFTTGEFAKRTGVTLRTLRYYDKIGLLIPSSHNNIGHRLYSINDFIKLQKISTLKFIGLSLKEISNTMKFDVSKDDFKKSLTIQKDIIERKTQHMHMVINAIDETLQMIDNNTSLNWNKFINIIKIINIDNNWLDQYKNASNLKTRIKIHDQFSTNEHGWMRWFFEHLEISNKSSILDLGCGDASLWNKNLDRIPKEWDITLTDFSIGMIKDAKNTLGQNSNKFNFKVVDAQVIPYADCSFNAVIANNMLYHVPEIEKAFSEIHRVLKPKGVLYASTVGKNHMYELRSLFSKFDSGIITTKSWDLTEKFQLENGLTALSGLFSNITLTRYNDSLYVTEASPLIDYIFSMPGNDKKAVDESKIENLKIIIEKEISKTKGIHITKDTGFFKAIKK